MAIKSNFFNNNVYYYAEDFNRQFNTLLKQSGILREGEFQVTSTSPMSLAVKVSSGSAYLDGIFIHSDDEVTLDVTKNETEHKRIDCVVLDLNKVEGITTLKVIEGEATSSPKAPEILPNQLKLANITVDSSLSKNEIESSDITMTTNYVFLSKKDIDTIVNSL